MVLGPAGCVEATRKKILELLHSCLLSGFAGLKIKELRSGGILDGTPNYSRSHLALRLHSFAALLSKSIYIEPFRLTDLR
jgi:hypothetical protein